MPKREIDTPAKDDPKRKKPRTGQDDADANANARISILNANANSLESSSSRSKPTPTLIQSVFTAFSSSVAAPDITASSEATVGAANRQKHATSAATGMARVWARAIRGGNLANKIPAAVGDKNTNAEPVTPPKPSLEQLKSSEVRKDPNIKYSDPESTQSSAKRSSWATSIIGILGILNIASLTYIICEQTRHNTAQMRCLIEIEKLNDQLARNRGVLSILQSGMDAAENRFKAMEEAQKTKTKEWEANRRNESFGLSEDEKNVWAGRKRVLMAEREQLLEGLNHWLVELEGMDGL